MVPLAALLVAVTSAQGPIGTSAFDLVPTFDQGGYVSAGVDVHQDGYLMVLQDFGGYVTILFPRRPTHPQTVHAGMFYQFGARDGFPELVAAPEARIVVAWSTEPFTTEDLAGSTFWSADSLRHWKHGPEALVRHASGKAPVRLISTTLVASPLALGSAGRLARRGRFGTLAERHPVYVPRRVWDAAPRSGVPPPVCRGGMCRYTAMRLIDLTPF
jgi:hypothetical protein